jgi:hypothetical protein
MQATNLLCLPVTACAKSVHIKMQHCQSVYEKADQRLLFFLMDDSTKYLQVVFPPIHT